MSSWRPAILIDCGKASVGWHARAPLILTGRNSPSAQDCRRAHGGEGSRFRVPPRPRLPSLPLIRVGADDAVFLAHPVSALSKSSDRCFGEPPPVAAASGFSR